MDVERENLYLLSNPARSLREKNKLKKKKTKCHEYFNVPSFTTFFSRLSDGEL